MSIEHMIRKETMPFTGNIRLGGIAFPHDCFTMNHVDYRTLTLIHILSDELCRWNPFAALIEELAKRKIEVVLLRVERYGTVPD